MIKVVHLSPQYYDFFPILAAGCIQYYTIKRAEHNYLRCYQNDACKLSNAGFLHSLYVRERIIHRQKDVSGLLELES